jgi:hypothetical protein
MAELVKLSPNRSSRNDTSVTWLAVHTAEGATTAESLANYLADPAKQVSYHTVCDDNTTIQCVPFADEAWAMLGGNPRADQICCTGFAAWSRDTWMAHRGMLDRIAYWLAARAKARGIPISHIGAVGVAQRSSGVIGHYDYTVGANDGTHTDPGPNFPWDYVINKALAVASQAKGVLEMPAGVIPSGPQTVKLVTPIGASISALVAKGWLSLASSEDAPNAHVWIQGPKGGISDHDVPLKKDKRWWVELPDGTDQMTIHTNSPGSVGWCLELLPR